MENENGNNVFGTYVFTNPFHCFAKEWPFLIVPHNYGVVCISLCAVAYFSIQLQVPFLKFLTVAKFMENAGSVVTTGTHT